MYFTMDKKRLRVALKGLEKLKTKQLETKDLIEDECQKEKISGKGVISFYKSRSKELSQKNIFYFVVRMLRNNLLS